MPRILVIDDEPLIRSLLRRVLESQGYEVLEAPDGSAGTRLYRREPCDLIITDILMPEQEGIQTIRELRRDFPDVKVIAISGGGKAMSDTDCLHLAAVLGAQRTFSKPLDMKELLKSVQELLES